MSTKLFVSSSPHVFAKQDTQNIMFDVLIALLPACGVGIYFFGAKAALIIALATFSAVFTEWVILKAFNRPGSIKDLSAAVTGLLLGMNLSVGVPWWVAVLGSVFAIAIVKQPFGGLGHNFVNPALAGRVFLVACWPVAMTTWVNPGTVDTISSATPMAMLKAGEAVSGSFLMNLAVGNAAGCIGEASAIALLAGGIYLFAKRIIRWRIPITYMVTVFVLSFLLGGMDYMVSLAHLLGGGLMLGAIYMATDYTTSPVTPRGQLMMGIGCGIMTVLIRLYSNSAEGVSLSILLMNVCVPLIDRLTKPKIFGEVKRNA
ncbi:MAG: RnfABCDGE type electron transport complex subunit D [Eubacteriales bacterium]